MSGNVIYTGASLSGAVELKTEGGPIPMGHRHCESYSHNMLL